MAIAGGRQRLRSIARTGQAKSRIKLAAELRNRESPRPPANTAVLSAAYFAGGVLEPTAGGMASGAPSTAKLVR